jgi:hypothetical protein
LLRRVHCKNVSDVCFDFSICCFCGNGKIVWVRCFLIQKVWHKNTDIVNYSCRCSSTRKLKGGHIELPGCVHQNPLNAHWNKNWPFYVWFKYID